MAATALAVGGGLLGAPSAFAAPTAEEFTHELPALERLTAPSGGGGEDEVTHRSSVIPARESFDLAGLRAERRHYELRGRTEGGEWTDWTETANGDPVWFGGMDELQVRTHGWQPEGQVHFVAVSEPDPAPTAAARTGDGGKPDIVSRRQWGANQSCEPRRGPDYGRVKAAAVHHTVSATNYSESEARGLVLGICHFHRNTNGWDDIGYNALVDRFGNIYEGRDGGLSRAVVGAQAQGVNAQTTGVAVVGTHTSTPISRAAMRGVSRWLAWKLPEHGRDGKGRARLVSAGGETSRYSEGTRFKVREIFGHRATNTTSCPGDALYRQLPRLREKVQRRIGDGGGGDGGGGGGIEP